jgi:hypothetical protein
MPNPILKFVNAETGEETERTMNAAEFKEYQAEQKAYAAKVQAEETKAADKVALLAKLGITADEAALLLS